MYLSKSQIKNLQKIILNINSLESPGEQKDYLSENVEDAELFVNVLKSVNKKKLPSFSVKRTRNISTPDPGINENEIILLFEQTCSENIIKNFSKSKLSSMYSAIYHKKPLSFYTKEQIVQAIQKYIHDQNRGKALL